MKRSALAFLALLSAAGAQEDPDGTHVRVYRKAAPAVVFVTDGVRKGSGVILSRDGVILTSPAACGVSGGAVTVIREGAKRLRGKVMGRVSRKGLALVKVEAEDLPALESGDSSAARVGQVVYVLGDSFESIEKDGRPAMSLGVISGIYEVARRQPGTYVTGKVLETTAAINPNQDGGPMVDAEGRLLGLVTLNYEESRFMGLAVPIHELKEDIDRIRKEFKEGAAAAPPKKGEAWFGAEARPSGAGLEIARVSKDGPAEKAGLRKGDFIVRFAGSRVPTEAALKEAVRKKSPGDTVEVTVIRDGEAMDFLVELVAKTVY